MTKISETTGKKIDPNPQIGDSLKAKMSIWIPKNNPMITPITINIIPRIAMVLLRVVSCRQKHIREQNNSIGAPSLCEIAPSVILS